MISFQTGMIIAIGLLIVGITTVGVGVVTFAQKYLLQDNLPSLIAQVVLLLGTIAGLILLIDPTLDTIKMMYEQCLFNHE